MTKRLSERKLHGVKTPKDKRIRKLSLDSPQPEKKLLPQENRVLMVGRIEAIVSQIPSGSFVGFDIDETLFVTRNSPSFLVTNQGVRAFQQFLSTKFDDFETRNQHGRNLQKALKDKVLVEDKTAKVIKALQAKGCFVFGLTARYAEMAGQTQRTLAGLGIELWKSAPLPQQPVEDPENEALCADGIIYCNGQDKGLVLDRFLRNIVLRNVLESVANNEFTPEIAKGLNLCPRQMFFIDDVYEHMLSLRDKEKMTVCAELKIPTTCFHYVSPLAVKTWGQRNLKNWGAILMEQMEEFANSRRVLTNEEAIERMPHYNPISD